MWPHIPVVIPFSTVSTTDQEKPNTLAIMSIITAVEPKRNVAESRGVPADYLLGPAHTFSITEIIPYFI
jgi:hypothetical protein